MGPRMKVVIVGVDDWSRWGPLDMVMKALGPDDTVIHNGSTAIGGRIDSIARRTVRGRRPRIEVQWPEVPKYTGQEAIDKNAMQLIYHHAPQVVVWFGDSGDEPEIRPTLGYAEKAKVPCLMWDEFVAQRTRGM